ncbi:MAG: hypothetical protein HY819_22465 [Acidobacteria bacterium]|nr:hypothetical protein [Acidobacteriota bacterium]
MHNLLGSCHIAIIRFKWSHPLDGSPRAHQLRGAVAKSFPDEPIFHQHEGGKFVYRYPIIQYRWERNAGIIMGINEGAEKIVRIPWLDLHLELAENKVVISDAEIYYRKGQFAISNRLERYSLLSPWVPFNQENYKTYQNLSLSEQVLERDRLLVAQILMTLRGLKIDFPERLYAAFELTHSVIAPYKDQALTGFLGHFSTNAVLPDHFAIGRAVSHGYGWFVKS